MPGSTLYVCQLQRASTGGTLTSQYIKQCVSCIDGNPDTYEVAVGGLAQIRIDVDKVQSSGALADFGIDFAGVWLGPRQTGWTTITLTAYSTSNPDYTSTATARGSLSGLTTLLNAGNRIAIATWSPSVWDRYWRIEMTGFSGSYPSVREILMGNTFVIQARWDWGGAENPDSYVQQEELADGRIVSRLQRQIQPYYSSGGVMQKPRNIMRTYELASQADKDAIMGAWDAANGPHGMIFLVDDGLGIETGRMVRFASKPVITQVQVGLYNISVSFKTIPVIPDGQVY